jgi:hypothetical protein
MNNYDKEPYQDEVNKVRCKFCGEDSDYDFCSDGCNKAYWNEFK